jgi:L-ascorbate metabolism protein UlaG (beta-lactamase superfamily)
VDPGAFSDADAIRVLTGLDAVVITHQHADHVDPALLAEVLENNGDLPVIAEPQTAAALDAGEVLPGGTYPGHLTEGQVVPLPPGGEVRVDALTVSGVGGWHAVIHPDIPRVGNTGLVISAEGEPRLGVTGDSLEAVPEFRGIDVLAFAVVAPWSKMRETIDFLREVRPVLALPVHDAIVGPKGRPIFLNQSTALSPEGTEVRDWPEDGSAVEV